MNLKRFLVVEAIKMKRMCAGFGLACTVAWTLSAAADSPRTYCNPLPLPELPRSVYEMGRTPHRQVSDPTLYRENGRWYVYPSAGLMWSSADDGGTWRKGPNPDGLQGHGPTMVKHRGRYFYMPDTAGTVYEASSPEGPWRKIGVIALPKGALAPADAMLFSDDDGRLYFYWGCSPVDGIWGCELDADDPCKPISAPKKLIPFDPVRHPWERHAGLPDVGWLEGAWMMKVGKAYVLVYSAGGAENVAYAMGAYRSDSPLGEFRPQKNNPFFVNPTGFITGTGHGSLVKDERGEWWISYCITVGDQHRFERRIGLDRIVVGEDGEIAVARATDEPQWLPKYGTGAAGWRRIPVRTASRAANDGLYQTHEWLAMLPAAVTYEFECPQVLRAFRICWREGRYDPDRGVNAGPVRYRVHVRRPDGSWQVACDASANDSDLVTDYRETEPVEATAARLEILSAPKGLELGLSEWTLFGTEVAVNDGAVERIVHLDEMDHLANRTALFNEGVGVDEAKYGVLMLHFATTNRVDCHKRFFPISVAPKAKDWTLAFRFRFDAKDAAREFGLKLYFGDPKNPETRLLTLREEGSFFQGGTKPAAPKEGTAGFLYGHGESGYGAWNSAAVTVSGTAATFWVMRGGKYVADCTGKLPAKPLIGWNLVATAEKTDFRFDRLMVTDGVARPYERGDLQEAIAELRKEPPPAWDAAFGAPMKSGETVTADLSKQDLTVRFRAPFRRRTKTEKAVGCVFELVGGEKPERIAFGAGDISGEAKYRVFKAGKFVETSVKTTVTNSVLMATGSRLGMHTVPPIRHWGGYETEEINELIAAQDAFRKPAERTYELKVVRDGANACRVSLDGQLLKTVRTSAPVMAVRFVGNTGAEARYAFSAAPGRAPETYELAVKKGGFKLERVRENLGTFMLECNHYLSRDGFEQMPSSCLWNVPRKQWARAKARCRIDPTAPPEHVPVITARLTHLHDNGGRSIAMCQETVDLSKPDPRVVKIGGEYEVTFDFDIASIMDLTSMTDGLARAELPFLHFEFTGPVWEKNRYYIDAGRSPAEELRSSVIVLGGSLEESPVWFRVTPERPYSLYYPGETPKVNVEFRPVKPGKYAVDLDVRQNDGSWTAERYFHIDGDGSCGCRWPVELPTKGGLGLYTVSYRVTDETGKVLQKYETSYGLLPENTREAGYDSPYYSWNFRGSHGTAPRFEDWAPAYDYLGVKRTLLDPNPRAHLMETNAQIAAHGFTHAEFPFIGPRDDSEKAKEEAKRRMRSYVEAFPHCKQALVFHESGGGPYPKELYGEKTVLNDWAKAHQSNRVAQATRAIRCWREVDPSVRMIVGNSAESYGLIAELMRGGLDKSLVDSWGEESVGLTMPPEMSTAFTPWCIKRLAKIYGYTDTMDCPWEWKCRTERYERSFRGAAAVNLRDDLIAHALGYRTIPVGCGTETANSYADTIWCSGTFSRWPMAYPRENALAVATQTLVLDRAKYRRQLKTGSLTAYALEFEAKDGRWIYALWTARGETTMTPKWANGGKILGFIPWKSGYELVTMLGRRSETDAETVAVGDEPVYLIAKDQIDGFETAKRRTFKYENPAALAANREVQALAKAAEVTLDFSEDCRIDPKFDSTPFRPGKFAVKGVVDEEKGACIELTHLSQAETPEIMQEYVFLKIREPKAIAKPFDTIGVWAKGNSNWGRVSFEITDAEGERWYSSGLGGVGCYVYDWPAKLAFNYDGWNFLQAPLTGKSDVKITGPGEDQWMWTRDGSGNSRIDWPVKVTAIGVSQYGRTLDLLDMKPSGPSIRLKDLSVR